MSEQTTAPTEREPSAMARFQDALGDYYDAGMIGDAPKLSDFKDAAA